MTAKLTPSAHHCGNLHWRKITVIKEEDFWPVFILVCGGSLVIFHLNVTHFWYSFNVECVHYLFFKLRGVGFKLCL